MERVRDAGRVSYRLNLIRDVFGAGALLARLKGRSKSRSGTAHALAMLVDALENRTLLSALPAPVTTYDTSIVGLNTTGTVNYSSPSVAYNPLNPLEVVEASVEDAPNVAGDQKVFIQLSYSTNGGTTWSPLNVNYNLVDPVATTTTIIHYYTAATDPTVAFDRLGNFYLSYLEDTSGTQGEIVLDRYSFTGNTPSNTLADQKVYSWSSIANAPGEALHPTMAVDDNVQSYTAGGVTLTDPTIPTSGTYAGQGPIYIAWANNYIPSPEPDGWNPNAILMEESSDGGKSWSAPVYMNTGGNTVSTQRNTYPELTISQGTLATTGGHPTVEPGQVTAVWDDFGTDSTASPPFDLIDSNHSVTTPTAPTFEVGADVVDPNNPTTYPPIPIPDATGSASPYTPTVTDIPFTLNVPSDFAFSNMSVELGIQTTSLAEYKIELMSPSGADLVLVANGEDDTGTAFTPTQGLTGSYLGVIQTSNTIVGTTLVDNLAPINSGSSPYLGSYSPEGGSFASKFGALPDSQLSGTWMLQITDYVADTSPSVSPELTDFKVTLSSLKSGNESNVSSTYVTGSLSGPFNAPGDYPASPSMGIGPAPVIASDNTLGDYSEYQGRIYVAFVDKASNATSNTNIALAYSTNGGINWTTESTKVNDDEATVDGYSGDYGGTGDRSQFEPSVAVDQANGTLVLTWYDARYDAADARVARFITTSLDGGNSFGGQTYLNEPDQVYDAISGQADDLGPIPDNFSADAQALIGEGQFYYGTQQGLAVFDGRVYATWTGNENQGPDGNYRLGILTSTTTYSSGPTIISSTQGVVSTPEDIVNPAQNLGGTTGIVPAFQYIDVTFDRPIVPSSFTNGDIDIQYRNDSTPGTQPPTSDISSLIGAVVPLNLQYWGGAMDEAATEFRIELTAPQTAVGTYSYFISPAVNDGYEYFGLSGTTVTDLTASTLDPTQANLVVPKLNSPSTSSKIVVPGGAAGVNQAIVDVQVNVQFSGANDAAFYQLIQEIGSEYTLTLSDGTSSVTLAAQELGASQSSAATGLLPDLAGHGYVSTTFDDESDEPIFDGNFQFSGTFQPEGNLAAFNGTTLTAGSIWTLEITSTHGNTGNVPTGLLRDWSIQFQTETLQTDETQPAINGNTMDQNGDAIPGQPASFTAGFQTTGDVWAMPTPISADSYTAGTNNYFTSPFASGTSAIIVPGPSIAQYVEYPATVGAGGVAIPSTGSITSTIVIGGASYETISDLIVKLQITYPKDNDLVITLKSPAGTPITLAALSPVTSPSGANPALNDANFGDSTNFGTYQYLGPTVFTDDATNSIAGVGSDAPYVGLYAPVTPLSNLDGESLAGTWTLTIQNVGGSSAGTLNAWSITAATQTAPTDVPINQIAIKFDRNMDPSTITNADVLSVTGPLGLIPGSYTITPDPDYDPNNLDPDSDNPRTYLIGFTQQTLSGTYVVALANSIESTDGTPLDTDQNAGVDMLNDSGGSMTQPYTATGGTLPPSYSNDGVYTSTISVPVSDANLISNISVTLSINTNRGAASDLSAVLIAPNGATVQLFANLSSATSFNGNDTTFEDISTISINSASSGYVGTFTPQQPLSSLLNSNSTGTWTLVIKNVGANTNYMLTNWSMMITTTSPNTGAGVSVADEATTSFQLFNLGATDDQSHEVWTPVGGTVNTGTNSAAGPVTAIAVDPSDPSGNTVFIGAATGGVWKTTNFLTTNPNGPTYIPLIANAPTDGLNIGSIAVLGSQTDPATGDTVPSMIFAATGNGNTNTLSPGIGILVSTDDGATWNLATGLTNTDGSGNWLAGSSASRDNTFDGLIAYKIVVDPRLQANGDAIIYVAFTDPTTNGKGGIYRSVDSGKTWTLMRAGQATDVVLDLNSAIPSFNNSDLNNPTDNVNAIDAAFAGDGIYRSPNRGVTWTELLGTNPDTNILDYSTGNDPPVNVANLPSPNGDFGRIVLATPSLTGNPTQDALYEGWLYAAVISNNDLNNPTGTLLGLYMTKDYGATWTQVQINGTNINGTVSQNPTDNTTQHAYDVTNGTGIPEGDGNYAVALSVDPNNPNVVYLAGSAYANYAAGMIRVDTTGISDAHAFYQGENAPDGGEIRADTTDVVALKNWYNTATPDVGNNLTSITEPTINLLQNPSEPFSIGSAVATNNIADVSNSGANITWLPFDYGLEYSNSTTTQPVDTPSEYHEIVTEIDPQTGLSRIIVATDQGVYSEVDQDGVVRENYNNSGAISSANEQDPSGSPQYIQGPNGPVLITQSLNEPISGSRNGNLDIAELYYGAVQPSQSAANAAGGLFYGEGQGIGLVSSSSGILTDGDTTWKSSQEPSGGGGVATDQVGTGTVYDYANPFWSGTYTDFYQVNGVGRTTGLLTTGADNNTSHDNEWGDFITSGNLQEGTGDNNQSSDSDFAVNPINASEIVISSHPSGDAGAQIFSTQNQGVSWSLIGTSGDLDDSYAPALAYGAPSTNVAEGNFIYAGTDAGHIYVTFTGGGNGTSTGNPWINISAGLDGSAVEAIVTDPNSNTSDAYAVTQDGVYYMANAEAQNPTWVNITGNLMALTRDALGGNYTETIEALTSLVGDWRYATPILYVSANPGVYQGIDQDGTWTWTPFPDASTDGAPQDGGYLPNVEVSDLALSTGNVDPTTGIPLSNTDANNILMASTFGDGAYAIRLAPIVTLNGQDDANPGVFGTAGSLTANGTTTYYVNADESTVTFNGTSEKTITENGTTYNQVTVNAYDLTDDPNETTPIGTATTNADGTFSINISRPSPDGPHDIVLVGVDQSGVTGPAQTIQLQVETTRPVITGFGLTTATDTGSSHTDGITSDNAPTVTGTGAPGAAVTVSITNSSNVTTTFTPVTADSNGVFNFTFPSALADGTYTVSAVETDLALNTSLPVSFTMKIVTSIATPSTPVLIAASDSGKYNNDDITNVKQPTFTGVAAATDTVTLYESLNGATPTADGTATADSNGDYTITLTNPFNTDGTYAITVKQTDIAANVSASSPALDVSIDTTPPVVTAVPVSANQYGTFNGTVGTLTDAHPNGSATITWGDGTTSAGTLVPTGSPTLYDIQGTHVYATTGTYSISITATDLAGNSASTPVNAPGTATVMPPAPAVSAIALNVNEGQSLVSVPVASFTNGAPNPSASEFTATIDWGDGSSPTTGLIVPDPEASGYFLVEGSHIYADGPNTYTTTITVTATGVANPTVATGTATVANVPPAVTLGGNSTGFINQIISLPITAIDPGTVDSADGFIYSINWGDGTTQTIAATANDGTGEDPTHSYSTAGNYTITVTATDKDGGVGTSTRALQIATAPTLSNVVINSSETQRSHIDTISFDLTSPSVPISTLDTTDLALVFDGETTNVSLSGATVTYTSTGATTGHVVINLTGVSLANGDYQLFVFPGTGVLPINFTKLTGDVNGDGFVTKADQKIVKADLGATAGQSNYNVNADVNGDGVVNATDLSLLKLDKTKKIKTKVIKLKAGKVIKAVKLNFPATATDANRAVPIQLQLENTDPSRALTLSMMSLLGGGANFSFAVLNQAYGASTFTIPAGGSLTIRVYFTPTSPGKFATQLKAQLSNDVQSTYGAVIAKITGKATAPKKAK